MKELPGAMIEDAMGVPCLLEVEVGAAIAEAIWRGWVFSSRVSVEEEDAVATIGVKERGCWEEDKSGGADGTVSCIGVDDLDCGMLDG